MHYVAPSRSKMVLLLFEIIDLRARCASCAPRPAPSALVTASVCLVDVCTDPKSLVIDTCEPMKSFSPFFVFCVQQRGVIRNGHWWRHAARQPVRLGPRMRRPGMRGVSLNVSPLCN